MNFGFDGINGSKCVLLKWIQMRVIKNTFLHIRMYNNHFKNIYYDFLTNSNIFYKMTKTQKNSNVHSNYTNIIYIYIYKRFFEYLLWVFIWTRVVHINLALVCGVNFKGSIIGAWIHWSSSSAFKKVHSAEQDKKILQKAVDVYGAPHPDISIKKR